MQDFLFQYHGVSPTTWAYLSSLLMIGLFFKFGRFWSVRNLDLAMLIFLAPGLLLIHYGNFRQNRARASSADVATVTAQVTDSDMSVVASPTGITPSADPANGNVTVTRVDTTNAAEVEEAAAAAETPAQLAQARAKRWELIGYYWLFVVSGLWLIRLLLDPAMIRRPLLTPNLSVGGLTFIGVFLFMFLMANVVARPVASRTTAVQPSVAEAAPDGATSDLVVADSKPAAANEKVVPVGDAQIGRRAHEFTARMDAVLMYQQERGPGYAVLNALPSSARKIIAILSHLAIVIGLVMIGYRHFDNLTNGIGAAVLYLMLPYTSQLTGRLDHVLPAALLVWAILCYRRPLLAGAFFGAAGGCIYYPLFALPIWLSFYWTRGLFRFIGSVVFVLFVMSLGLLLVPNSAGLLPDLQRMFGVRIPEMENLEGVWNIGIGGVDPQFRISVLAAFVVLSFGLALWPARKNMGTIICYTAAVMVAAQFWHGYGGGLYMAWYLPLVLLTIFRPNLEDRIAQAVIVDGWFSRGTQNASVRSLAA